MPAATMRRHCVAPTGRTTAPALGVAPGRLDADGAGADVGAATEVATVVVAPDEAGAAELAAVGRVPDGEAEAAAGSEATEGGATVEAHAASASTTALTPVTPTRVPLRIPEGYAEPSLDR
jgi:hypothetical protein